MIFSDLLSKLRSADRRKQPLLSRLRNNAVRRHNADGDRQIDVDFVYRPVCPFPDSGNYPVFINKDKDAVLAKRCLKAALITWAVQIGFSLVVGIGVPLIAIIFGSAVSEVEATTPAIGAALAVTLR